MNYYYQNNPNILFKEGGEILMYSKKENLNALIKWVQNIMEQGDVLYVLDNNMKMFIEKRAKVKVEVEEFKKMKAPESKPKPKFEYEIWTDGSVKGNGYDWNYGAQAFLVQLNGTTIHEQAEFIPKATNNQAEMKAIISALTYCLDNNINNVIIYSDSEYCVKGITIWIHSWVKSKWKNGSVKNIELWREMYSLTEKLNVKFQWIKGHSGIDLNEYVDGLCTSVYDTLTSP